MRKEKSGDPFVGVYTIMRFAESSINNGCPGCVSFHICLLGIFGFLVDGCGLPVGWIGAWWVRSGC